MTLCWYRQQWLDADTRSTEGAAMLAENAAEEAAAAAAMGVRRVGTVEDLQCLEDDLEVSSNDRATSGSRCTPTTCISISLFHS